MREFCRTAIYFDADRYFLLRKDRSRRRRILYELAPWPADRGETPSAFITYDRDYVSEREQAERRDGAEAITGALLFMWYPLIGMFPSALKSWLAARFGVNPQSATRVSL